MPKKYDEIVDEWKRYKALDPQGDVSISDYAKAADEEDPAGPQRHEAYNATGVVGVAKDVNSAINKGLSYTGLPQAAGWVGGEAGRQFDTTFGTHIAPTMESVGESLPRGIAEGAATLGSGPLGWAARLLGYGSAALQGTAQTDSLLGGAIGAGSLKASNVLVPKAATSAFRSVQDFLKGAGHELPSPTTVMPTMGIRDAAQQAQMLSQPGRVVAGGAGGLAGLVTQGAIAEGTRQAEMSVGPNKVGLLDAERNPFTQENIAAQVGMSLAGAPQVVHGLMGAPRANVTAVTKLNDWLKQREAHLQADAATLEGPINAETYREVTGKNPRDGMFNSQGDLVPVEDFWSEAYTKQALDGKTLDEAVKPDPKKKEYGQLLKVQLDNLAQSRFEGRTTDAQQAEAAIYRLKEQLGGEAPAGDLDGVAAAAQGYDAIARMAPPDSPKGFAKFVADLNGLLDEININTVEFTDAQKNAKTLGETWHPSARDPLALKQLGVLEPITEKWLRDQYNATFDSSGNPQFAYRVVLQKVAAQALNGVEAALEHRKTQQVATDFSPGVRKASEGDRAFVESLLSFPSEVRDQLAARTAEIYGKAPSQSQMASGASVEMTQRRAWEMAVIQAAKTFDAQTGTVKLKLSKKGPEEIVRLDTLFQRDEHGNYIWEPPLKQPKGVERKNAKETKMPEVEKPVFGDEEEAYFHDLEQQEPAAFLGRLDAGKQLGALKGATEPVEPRTAQVHGERRQIEETAQELRSSLDKLDPATAYDKFKDLFVRRSATGLESDFNPRLTEQRKAGLKGALEAAFEDFVNPRETLGPKAQAFVEARKAAGVTPEGNNPRRVFQGLINGFLGQPSKDTPVPAGLQHLPPYKQRMYQFLTRLVDPKKLEGLMRGPEKAVAPGATKTEQHSGGMVSTFSNVPAPGQFVPDVIRTFRAEFNKRLRSAGYSGSILDTYTELATSLALTKKDVPAEFYKLDAPVSGLATEDGTKAMVGIGMKSEGKLTQTETIAHVNDMMRVLAHELSHIDQFIVEGSMTKPDAMSDEELRAARNIQKLSEVLQPEERSSILTELRDALVPKEYQPNRQEASGMPYGTSSPTEFVAELNGYLFHALMGGAETNGQKSALDVIKWMPEEIAEFAQGRYRTVADILDGARESMRSPLARQLGFDAALPTHGVFLSEAFDAAVETARSMSKLRDADFVKAQTQHFLANISPGSALGMGLPTQAEWTYGPKMKATLGDFNIAPSQLPAAQAVINATRRQFITKPEGWYSRFLYPFTNLMVKLERAGNPLARDVLNMAFDVTPARDRLLSSMREAFLTRDAKGRLQYDNAGLLLEKLRDDQNGPWRKSLNAVRAFQNENKSQSMFVQGPQGLSVDPKFQADWTRMSRGLSTEDAQVVMNFSAALDKTYQTAAAHLAGALLDSVKNRTTALLMTMNKGMEVDQARMLATEVGAAFESGNFSSVQGKLSPDQLTSVQSLLGGSEGIYTKWTEVKDHLASRPGFSSERLPGDYLIQYDNANGETKYLGAKNQTHAEIVQKRLVDEGMKDISIVNKADITKYTDFDDPSEVLSKFQQTEARVWERFLKEHEAKYGAAAVQELRDSYNPGASSMGEMEAKGLGGFMKERQSKVDRERFDYIDAMGEYTAKLATSLVYRSIRQQLNLTLNDPRLRAYPSFEKIVKPHFDQIMSPNPQWLAEARSFVSGYFMAGNLSSAIVEGTQSATMLVPNLIRMGKGGAIKAYGTLSRAMTDAFKFTTSNDYLRVASDAQRRDSTGTSWSAEETRAVIYDRAVKDGLTEASVINDPEYGRDQRAAFTARFGHGDYGKVTLGELLRNKVYVANQMLMKVYNVASHANNKLAILAGAQQAHELGLRGDAAYRHAQLMKSLSTLSGGKTNAPGIAGQFQSPLTRSAYGLASTLQQYGLGTVATFAELGRESLGLAKGLSLSERRQAQKAFATMLTTQVAIGGALSLPFAAASLAFLENFFGIEAGAAVREGLAGLAGEDDQELGSTFANVALNGAGNQLTGFDVSARVGVSNLFGSSAYRGFSAADVFGPAGSIINNGMQALNLFGQGDPVRAGKALVPVAFKAPFEALDSQTKYGDTNVRDQSGSLLYEPTQAETIGMLAGFRPQEVSQKRMLQKQLALSEQNYQRRRGEELDLSARELLEGDPTRARNYVMDQSLSDPTTDRRALYRSIVDRAAQSQIEKDLLSTGSYGNSPNQRNLAASYGAEINPRRSEMDLLRLKLQLGGQLGPEAMPDKSSFRKAGMVDALTADGSIRSEASRLAEFLSSRHPGR